VVELDIDTNTVKNEKELMERFKGHMNAIADQIGRVIVGQEHVVESLLIAMMADGHVLIEGVPGLGKTLLIRCLSQIMDLRFNRIQFTPDLMPADIVGTNIIEEDPDSGKRRFRFEEGPVFSNIVLADEINRATPKTQSALLEAMQERSVTVSGQHHELDRPFFVLATQNPLEMEGTYPLPEAQVDRFFFMLKIGYPTAKELGEILERTTGDTVPEPEMALGADDILAMQDMVRKVPIASHVREHVVRLVMATHPDDEGATDDVRKYVEWGASPRAAQTIILAAKARALVNGRFNVSFDDVRAVAVPAMRHRIILGFEGETENVDVDELISGILRAVPEDE